MDRRTFLTVPAAAAAQSGGARFRKSICSVIFPDGMPHAERFRRARAAGFEGMEIRMGDELTVDSTPEDAKRMGAAAREAGIAIVSFWVSRPFDQAPLNHPDPAVRTKGAAALIRGVELASAMGCGAVLTVPGRLGNGAHFNYGYQETWERFTAEFRKLIPHAARHKVVITPENVWNKFLVSPLEMRAFVDQFRSPWLQTHFDIGNVMQFGYPQDWILTLGPRIRRVHVKDYKLSTRFEQGRFVDLLEGDVDWKEVMAALVKVGYQGYLSPEIGHKPEDPEQLMGVSKALDRILAMA
jgi:hexulose-6-phosphate isomerase